jgi:hypothetical protein
MRLTLVAIAVLLAFGAVPGPSQAAADPFQQAIALERAGHLRQAGAVLAAAHVKGAQAKHEAALDDALAAFRATDVYAARKQYSVAESTLTDTAKRIDPVRDLYVRAELQKRLAAVQKAATPPAKSDPSWGDGVWKDFKDAGRSVLKWLAIASLALLIVLAIAGVGWVVRQFLPVRKTIGASLEDLAMDPDKHPDGGRALGRELASALKVVNTKASADPAPGLDSIRDLDGSMSLNVRVAGDELAILAPYADNGSAVKFGGLSVSPRQVLALLGTTFSRRPEYDVRGSLAGSDKKVRLDAELRHEKKVKLRHKKKVVASWTCDAEGEGARAGVLADAAYRIVFEVGPKTISDSWPSVACYREARALLSASSGPEDREATLAEARRMLERSLRADPKNPLARFELGGVLRKLGANREAADQYERVEKLCEKSADPAIARLRRAGAYNRAIALSKMDGWREHNDALGLLHELVTEIEGDQTLKPADRERMLLYVNSAQAATLVFKLEQWRDEQYDEATRERSELVFEQIQGTRDAIAALPERKSPEERAIRAQAGAVAENAFGRASYLLGKGGAIEAFTNALSDAPELGDAHVNMASALFRERARHCDWDAQIDYHLERSLTVSPNDRKALYLRGKLNLALHNEDDAKADWELAAKLRLAELLWADKSKLEAIELVQRSQARRPAHDERARLLILWTCDIADEGAVEEATLRAARRAGDAVERYDKKRKKKTPENILTALGQIDAKLKVAAQAGANGDAQAHLV